MSKMKKELKNDEVLKIYYYNNNMWYFYLHLPKARWKDFF